MGIEAGHYLSVLLVEDSEIDALFLKHALTKGGFRPHCHRVETAESMVAALAEQSWDVILADHSMPRFSAPEALKIMQQHGLDLPFIIVSGYIEEEAAVAAMKAGAHDYIMKDRRARLVPAVERELREAALRRAQREFEAQLRRTHDELEMRVEQRTAALSAANAQLNQAFEIRRQLENELLEIAENERRRIGFDLHDDLGQKLTGLSMMIKGLEQRLTHDQHPWAKEAGEIRELISSLVRHTHNLAHQFGSLDIRGADVSEVFKELAVNVNKMFDVPCAVAIKGPAPALPANTTTQLYKIAQEAVSNAIKHGHATRIRITAACVENNFILTIRNDGVAFFVPVGKKNRMGLRIMNYRANTIGATFDIKPNGRSGTIVSCAVPIETDSISQREETVRPVKATLQHRTKARRELVVEPAVA